MTTQQSLVANNLYAMNLETECTFIRGYLEFSRGNFSKAYSAFEAAIDHPQAMRFIAFTYQASEFPIDEVITAHLDAYDHGNMMILAGTRKLMEESAPHHPDLARIITDYESKLKSREPDFLYELFTIEAESNIDLAARFLLEAAKHGSQRASNELVRIILLGSSEEQLQKKVKSLAQDYFDVCGKFAYYELSCLSENDPDEYPDFYNIDEWDQVIQLLDPESESQISQTWATHFYLFTGIFGLSSMNFDIFLNKFAIPSESPSSLWNSPYELIEIALTISALYPPSQEQPKSILERLKVSPLERVVNRIKALGLEDLFRDSIDATREAVRSAVLFEADDPLESPFSAAAESNSPTTREWSPKEIELSEMAEEVADLLQDLKDGENVLESLKKLFTRAQALDDDFFEYVVDLDHLPSIILDSEDWDDKEIGPDAIRDPDVFRFFFTYTEVGCGDLELVLARSPYCPEDVLLQLAKSEYEAGFYGTQECIAEFHSNVDFLTKFAESNNPCVRSKVAHNPNTPLPVLKSLIGDVAIDDHDRSSNLFQSSVAYKLATNLSVTKEILSALVDKVTVEWVLTHKENHLDQEGAIDLVLALKEIYREKVRES